MSGQAPRPSQTTAADARDFVEHSESFDPEAFRRYLKEVAMPEETNSKVRDIIAAQVDELLERRAKKKG